MFPTHVAGLVPVDGVLHLFGSPNAPNPDNMKGPQGVPRARDLRRQVQRQRSELHEEDLSKQQRDGNPGTGHFVMLEKPAEFNKLLAGFLAKVKF